MKLNSRESYEKQFNIVVNYNVLETLEFYISQILPEPHEAGAIEDVINQIKHLREIGEKM